jgi:hypothetical protein
MSQHKVAEKALLCLYGIATAEFYGFYHPGTGRSRTGSRLKNASDFRELCQSSEISTMAVKMPEGSCGYGFDIIDIDISNRVPIYSRKLAKRFSMQSYLQLKFKEFEGQGLVLEAAIDQHPALANLNPSSVNTLRVWVRQSRGSATVKSALLKIGHPGSLVDYTELGGLSVPIDIQTGMLGEPRLRPSRENAAGDILFDKHLLDEFELPFRKEAFSLAERSLTIFPHISFAGVDIAFSADGPLMVELNVEPDYGHAAMVGIPTLQLLSPLPGYGETS